MNASGLSVSDDQRISLTRFDEPFTTDFTNDRMVGLDFFDVSK